MIACNRNIIVNSVKMQIALEISVKRPSALCFYHSKAQTKY